MAYKFAADVYNSKKSNYKGVSLSPEERALPDFYRLDDVVHKELMEDNCMIRGISADTKRGSGAWTGTEAWTGTWADNELEQKTDRCSDLATKLSALLCEFPELSTSRVSVNEQCAHYYIVDDEGTRAKEPVSVAYVNVVGSVILSDGKSLSNFMNIAAPIFERMPSLRGAARKDL